MKPTADQFDPAYADWPTAEYEKRLTRAQELMLSSELDAILVVQRENVEYFTGFRTGHWGSKTFATAAALLPARGEPILVIPGFFEGNAATSSWIRKYEMFSDCHARPRGFADAVVSAVKRLNLGSAVIGIELGENLSGGWNLADYEVVRESLPSADIRTGASVIWGCRTIKSPLEVAAMRGLVSITDDAIRSAYSKTEIGTTEVEIGSWVTGAGVEGGADSAAFLNIRAGLPRYGCSDSPPVNRPIQRGDTLIVDVGLSKSGYQTDVAYVSHVGKPQGVHSRFYETVIEAHEAVLKALRPGVKATDIYEAGRRVLADSGLGKYIDMMGHGIGRDIHEPPIITPYSEWTVQPGMIFAIEPWLYDTSNVGVFCVEEIVLVTEDGIENFSGLPRNELHQVGS